MSDFRGFRRGPGACAAWLAAMTLALAAPGAHLVYARAEDWPPVPPLQITAMSDAGSTPSSVRAKAIDAKRWECTFRFHCPEPAQSVSLAGSFNEWSRAATPMARGEDGAWSATIALQSGRHEYKFVIDQDRWVSDPQNPEGAPDGHEGANSVLRLGRLSRIERSDAHLRDGKIDADGLEHLPDMPMYFQPLAKDRILMRYRTMTDDVERVSVLFRNGRSAALHLVRRGPLCSFFEAVVEVDPALTAGLDWELNYAFVLEDGDTRVTDGTIYHARYNDDRIFSTPDWASHAVWYQIMLDRFRNGDPANDPTPCHPWTSDWFATQPYEAATGQTFYKHFVFDRLYGGDIAGLEQKLGYLKELGVNAIYLNPVFKADSHHKYNATDYLHIDDYFGTIGDYAAIAGKEDLNDPTAWTWTESDRKFLAFVEKAHAEGFKVILDGVFNHVGTNHPAFLDVKKNGRESPYADWFEVTSWEPFTYVGWAGHDQLPVFRKSSDGLASDSCKQHIFNVTRRWMDPNRDGDPSDGIDGWRLDVPNEIALPFWAEWRKLVKSINPQAYIVGEIWQRADQWLDGRHFDAVMNYEFAKIVIAWAMHEKMKITPSQLDERLADLRLAYPLAATLVMQNLVDSHDTDRLVSMALNPDRGYDERNRVQDNGPEYNNDKPQPVHYARARLVALVQMTYIGAPMIYYGDEVGVWGADDPTCRKPMLWEDLQPYENPDENHVMPEHLAFYRQAAALRNAHPALRTGEFQTLLADDAADVWVFARYDEKEVLIVALNASGQLRQIDVPVPSDFPQAWRAVFGIPGDGAANVKNGKLRVQIAPISGTVLHARSTS